MSSFVLCVDGSRHYSTTVLLVVVFDLGELN